MCLQVGLLLVISSVICDGFVHTSPFGVCFRKIATQIASSSGGPAFQDLFDRFKRRVEKVSPFVANFPAPLSTFSFKKIDSPFLLLLSDVIIICPLCQVTSTEEPEPEKTDNDIMFEYLDSKPWRAPKIRNLDVEYRPWKDSWKERYTREEDDTIHLYATPSFRAGSDNTQASELWFFPWLWTKVVTLYIATYRYSPTYIYYICNNKKHFSSRGHCYPR